jgi:hypothetical protein
MDIINKLNKQGRLKGKLKEIGIYLLLLIIIVIIVILIYYLIKLVFKNKITNVWEGFDSVSLKYPWSKDLITRFNIYQQSVNRNEVHFNLDILQNQATPEEVEELLKTGYWPWPSYLENLYIEKVWNSPIVKIDPEHSLNFARTIYNKNAALHLLGWNEKEGEFLLYGLDIGKSDNMPKNVRNTIKCTTKGDQDVSQLEKKIYTGKNLWNGYMNYDSQTIDPKDMEKEIQGFSFVKGECNPCVALDGDNSCPFRLNIKGDNNISETWKVIWGL